MSASSARAKRLKKTARLPRIHLISDVHLETGPYPVPDKFHPDIVVAAGDIAEWVNAVAWLKTLGRPVIYVAGNHEHYRQSVPIETTIERLRVASAGTNVHFLENDCVILAGVRFVGCTLWTNFGDGHEGLMDTARRCMNDYNYIAQFSPGRALALHRESVAFLDKALAEPFDGPTVVVTHHAPCYESLTRSGLSKNYLNPDGWWLHGISDHRPIYRVAAYASDLSELMSRHARVARLWLHGHVHSRLDYAACGVRVQCNPRGYHQPAMTASDAAARRFWGARYTEEDIARDRADFAARPWRGNGEGFDRRLLFRADADYRCALALELGGEAERLEALALELKRIQAFFSHKHPVIRMCVRDTFRARLKVICEAFTAALQKAFSNLLPDEVEMMRDFTIAAAARDAKLDGLLSGPRYGERLATNVKAANAQVAEVSRAAKYVRALAGLPARAWRARLENAAALLDALCKAGIDAQISSRIVRDTVHLPALGHIVVVTGAEKARVIEIVQRAGIASEFIHAIRVWPIQDWDAQEPPLLDATSCRAALTNTDKI